MSIIDSTKRISIITYPLKLKRSLKAAEKLKKKAEKQNILMTARKGNLSIPIITCKHPNLNFYKGQTYGKFQSIPLASERWEGRKLKGDFFTINKHAENPAFSEFGSDLSFEDLGLNSRLVKSLNESGFETPTNIQSLAIPKILKGSNTLIAAETGNGKTFAFLAPIINQILKHKETSDQHTINSPSALVIVPSRELVTQTRDMARLIANPLGVSVNSIIGGRTERMKRFPRVTTVDILVGSFGVMSKLMTSGIYKRTRVSHIVLDEADTLLDDTFNEKVTYFLSKFPIRGKDHNAVLDTKSGVQVSFVGATFPRSINKILKHVIDMDSVQQIKTPHLHKIPPHITQTFLRINNADKSEMLLNLVKKNNKQKIPTIIFSNTSTGSDYVSLFLNDNDVPCVNLNGDMVIKHRLHKFTGFQNGEVNVLSCTDLASRGLDTTRVRHVINFDFPRFISDYIHRIGRTGRVGSNEVSNVTNFIQRKDVDLVQQIEYAVRKAEDFHNVNANIRRIINFRRERYAKRMEERAMETKLEEQLNKFN